MLIEKNKFRIAQCANTNEDLESSWNRPYVFDRD